MRNGSKSPCRPSCLQADITMDIIRTNAAIIKDMIEHCEEDE